MQPVFGFVGIIGKGASNQTLRFPQAISWSPKTVHESVNAKILVSSRSRSEIRYSEKVCFPLSTYYTGNPYVLTSSEIDGSESDFPNDSLEHSYTLLDGRFSLVSIQEGRLFIASDLIGAGGLYFALIEKSLYFASHLGLLLRNLPSSPSLDAVGIAGMLAGNHSGPHRTIFKGISRLQGGCALSVPLQQEVDQVVPEELLSLSKLARKDDLGEIERSQLVSKQLCDSILRNDGDTCHLLLSGGLDSQAIAKAAKKSRKNLSAYNFGRPQSADTRGAKIIAKKLGAHFEQIPFDNWNVTTRADWITSLMGGTSGPQVLHMIASLLSWDAPGPLMHGFLGDAISGAHISRREEPSASQSFRINFENAFGGKVPNVFEFFPEEIKYLEEEHHKLYNHQLSQLAPHQRLIILDLQQRQALRISTVFEMADSITPTIDPFYYRPLIRTFLSSPFDHIWGQKVYRRSLEPIWNWRRTPHGFIEIVLHRLFGIKTSRENTNWRERIQPHRDWVNQAISVTRNESLKEYSAKSLELWQGNTYPQALVGVGISMADYYAANSDKDWARLLFEC